MVLLVKSPPANAGDVRNTGSIPGLGFDPLKEGMAIHSSILAWRIPWTEEPNRLQSIGSQRVGHDWSNLACTLTSLMKNGWFPTQRPWDGHLWCLALRSLNKMDPLHLWKYLANFSKDCQCLHLAIENATMWQNKNSQTLSSHLHVYKMTRQY